jgi:hypothetical protein
MNFICDGFDEEIGVRERVTEMGNVAWIKYPPRRGALCYLTDLAILQSRHFIVVDLSDERANSNT